MTKTIKKSKKNSNKQSVSTSIPQNRAPRKINHRKYTVKKCSNFLRMTLKKNGFKNFRRLEGGCTGAQEDRNRRGSTIYLPACLLTLFKTLPKDRFEAHVVNYLEHLTILKEKEKKKLKATRNEKSYHYMIEFDRARETVLLFSQGKELECIEHFFGAHEDSHKERTYLKESIDFYNQLKAELEGSHPEDSGVQMMEIETPMLSEQDLLEQELNSYLDL